ncbi:MAG: type II toxin-antitoxin system RelB/DinJ family antitoxin [Oscillospiraceae bacterium]|nr:type II toxin-antitoxin system RelB/DinJ family antitoxin [Oscillospiraceae bacterium]
MAKTANLYARIEPDIKEQAEEILDALGVPVSNAINMFYKQIILQRGIPFEVKLPAVPVPDMSVLTKEQLKSEIEKGFADVDAGRVTPAAEVFADLRREYRS